MRRRLQRSAPPPRHLRRFRRAQRPVGGSHRQRLCCCCARPMNTASRRGGEQGGRETLGNLALARRPPPRPAACVLLRRCSPGLCHGPSCVPAALNGACDTARVILLVQGRRTGRQKHAAWRTSLHSRTQDKFPHMCFARTSGAFTGTCERTCSGDMVLSPTAGLKAVQVPNKGGYMAV